MTKAEILQIVYTISSNKADPVTCERYFDELLDQLGRHSSILTKVETAPVVKNTAEYDLPSDCVVETAILFDSRQLSKTDVQQLEAYDINWKQKVGKPICYTKDELTARRIRLYPIPDVSTGPYDYTYGEPLGLSFPPYSLTYIFNSRTNTNIPNNLVLALTFQILCWEFARPSKQQSLAFSKICSQLAVILFHMAGIKWVVTPATEKNK